MKDKILNILPGIAAFVMLAFMCWYFYNQWKHPSDADIRWYEKYEAQKNCNCSCK